MELKPIARELHSANEYVGIKDDRVNCYGIVVLVVGVVLMQERQCDSSGGWGDSLGKGPFT